MKRVVRFAKKGKLSPRYVGSYEILQRVSKVVYELKLPSELSSVHPIFHVSMLKKCFDDPDYILPIEGLDVKKNHSYEEILVQLSWLLIRLLSYGFIMIKLRWIISLSC